MNVPTVHSAVISTMLMAPITAAPPKTMPGVTTSPPPLDPDAEPSCPNRSLRVSNTPSALRTPYSTPTATIQMKNSAIDRTSEIFSADQVSMCRNCRRARRGPRLFAVRPRPRTGGATPAGAVVVAAVGDWAGVEPVADGTGGAPAGPPAGGCPG